MTENAYNFYDSLKKFKEDADIEMFLAILEGDLAEDVYFEQVQLIDNFMKLLRKADLMKNR